jgi:ABC-type spermidine/putrescine transport system permease subunit II
MHRRLMKAGLKGDIAALAVMMLMISIIGIAIAAWLMVRGSRGKTLGGLLG